MHKHIVLLNDNTIIELDFAKYRDLSVSLYSPLTNHGILLNLVQ